MTLRPRESVSQQPGRAGVPGGVSEQPERGHKSTHVLISAVLNYRTGCNLGTSLNSFLEKVKPSTEAAILPVTLFIL